MKPTFSMREKKVILFDLQDTLVDPKAALLNALEATLNEFTARWMSDNALISWRPADSVNRYKQEIRGRKAGERMEALRIALAQSPFPVTDAFLTSVWSQVRELTPLYAHTYPHVHETLTRLQPHYRLAIISNSSRHRLADTLYSAELESLFPDDHIFLSSDINKRKPSPALFDKALKTLGIKPSDSVMVGNSWRNDVQGAMNSHIDAVWLHKSSKKTVKRRIGGNRLIIVSRFNKLLSLFEHVP